MIMNFLIVLLAAALAALKEKHIQVTLNLSCCQKTFSRAILKDIFKDCFEKEYLIEGYEKGKNLFSKCTSVGLVPVLCLRLFSLRPQTSLNDLLKCAAEGAACDGKGHAACGVLRTASGQLNADGAPSDRVASTSFGAIFVFELEFVCIDGTPRPPIDRNEL